MLKIHHWSMAAFRWGRIESSVGDSVHSQIVSIDRLDYVGFEWKPFRYDEVFNWWPVGDCLLGEGTAKEKGKNKENAPHA